MRVLLDENLPHAMRQEITGHEVFTVAYMGWSGIENGELLQHAVAADFGVLVTNDRGLEYEQDLASQAIAVIVVLPLSNTIEALRPLLPRLQSVLEQVRPGQLVKVSADE
jgi:Domain of unknown function (DUF5615)